MERDVRRFRDAYGQEAVFVRNAYGFGGKLTFKRGKSSYTEECRSIQHARSILGANGIGWKEIDRWQATTPMA